MIFLVRMSSNSEGISSRESSPSTTTWIFTTMCLRVCIDGLSMSERVGCLTFCGSKTRMERAIRNLLWSLKISLTRYVCICKVWQRLNNSCKASPSLGSSMVTVILDRDPKSMIGCPSGRRAEQNFMMVMWVRSLATNSCSWIEFSGKATSFSWHTGGRRNAADIQVFEVDARY